MSESKTNENLYKAFVGEAKASLRLKGYAERADRDGYPQIARLFRAISRAEEIHALKHLRLLEIIGSTEENLEASFESELKISENVYPEFMRIAVEEENRAAEMSFSHARDAEEVHGDLYKGALNRMISETESTYRVCEVCGYVVEGDPPDECPVCKAGEDRFAEVA